VASNAAINQDPPARRVSARPGRALGGDRSVTRTVRHAPELVARDTLPRRRNTRAEGGAALSNGSAKELTAGCEWFRWGESGRSARA
jgi:hypothetical protein